MTSNLRRASGLDRAAAPAHYLPADRSTTGMRKRRRQGGDWAFWALVCFTIILFGAPQRFFPFLYSFRIAQLSAIAAIGLYVFNRLQTRRPILPVSRETILILAFVFWAFLTLPFSYWPGGSYDELVNKFLKTVVIFLLLCNVIDSTARLRKFIWALSLTVLVPAMSGIMLYRAGEFVAGGGRIGGVSAPLTSNPNDLALTLNLIMPLTIALLLHSRGLKRWLLLGMVLTSTAATVATFSRGGFLTLATIALAYGWKFRKRRERVWVVALLLLALFSLPFLPEDYVDRMGTIANMESDQTGSAQERWDSMAAAVRFVVANPIVGAGIGTNAQALNEYGGPQWTIVHNVYLQVAVELALPGLILYLLLMKYSWDCARRVRRLAGRKAELQGLFLVAEGLGISLLAFAVAAVFHPVAYHPYFFYIGGLAIALKRALSREEETSEAARA